ncbi:MAG: diguanylate cyclase [Ruminococcus sp.]|nr:diguanylate cyclase [Ruminococcus sp.]
MKSIQTKLIGLIMISIIVSVVFVGSVGILTAKAVINKDSENFMHSICNERAQHLNNIFARTEQSVNILSQYVADNFEGVDKIDDGSEYLKEYAKRLDKIALTTAEETDGAASVYIKFNPDLSPSTPGLFRVKNAETGEFIPHPMTDLSSYTPDDTEHVGWYYEPVKAGRPMWLLPYYNRNIDIYMISYVVPVYVNDILIGIVGMDIDFEYLTQLTDSIKLYDTGFAFLTDVNFNIIYHKNISMGKSILEFSENFSNAQNAASMSENSLLCYTRDGVEKKAAFRMLDNRMCLAVSAPSSEIDKTRNELVWQIIVIAMIIMGAFLPITVSVTKRIVGPLRELNSAAQEIADGNLDIVLNCNAKDEVGTLTRSFKETVTQLKLRIDYINSLAYADKLTGIKNNTAYLHDISGIKEEINNGTADFAVAVVDVNGLKFINDTYGHNCGNTLIITAAKLLSEAFGKESVYRTGGDEFTVILKNTGSQKIQKLQDEFTRLLDNQNGEIILSAAIGTSVFDKNTDESYDEVYKRADELMYTRKSRMKANGESSSMA